MTIAMLPGPLFSAPRQALIRLVLALAIITLIAGCSKPPPPAAKPPAEVTTIVITPRDTPVTMEFVAQTESADQVNIQARVSGFLDKTMYVEGEPVKKGQVLFLMDQKPFQAQLDAALAAELSADGLARFATK